MHFWTSPLFYGATAVIILTVPVAILLTSPGLRRGRWRRKGIDEPEGGSEAGSEGLSTQMPVIWQRGGSPRVSSWQTATTGPVPVVTVTGRSSASGSPPGVFTTGSSPITTGTSPKTSRGTSSANHAGPSRPDKRLEKQPVKKKDSDARDRDRAKRPVRGATMASEPPPTGPLPAAVEHTNTYFTDLAGLDEAITELAEVREYLTDPQRFERVGAELPRGILLFGPPGCGKTLLARALAGETGVPFFSVSAASFVEQVVGLGSARVRQLFDEARSHAPSIVFIDELDAIGRARDDHAGSGSREFDHTLNQLLVELDGFGGNNGVLLIGATNRLELIDPALLRPGRFDRRIEIGLPTRRGRDQILRLHAAKRPMSAAISWAEVAADTSGLNGAELANIVNESALLAARQRQSLIEPEDVWEAVARVVAGTGSSRLIRDEERILRATHEAGHALLTLLMKGMRPPSQISIVSRKGAFERSQWVSPDDRAALTKRELMAQLIVLLGGRAAELLEFGEPSTQAEDDLQHAAALARRMVEQWAMTGRFELAASREDKKTPYFEGSAGGGEVRTLLAGAEQAAKTILGDNLDSLRHIADTLAERETLIASELAELHQTGTLAAPPRLLPIRDQVIDVPSPPRFS